MSAPRIVKEATHLPNLNFAEASELAFYGAKVIHPATMVPAVRKVLENGKIDPERVGLVGHSWGAYQTAFLVTHCDLFAAGVAGAPLTNMMSMSMSIYWNTGQTDAHIFHESQGRMDRPFCKDVET